MKKALKVFLAWCIMHDDSEHGVAIVAYDEEEARRFIVNANSSVKAVTIVEAKGTTKLCKDNLHEMYEKQLKGV